ncbi:MAG: hypothetical protein GOU99_00740 [Candidatus Altiarchaeota archaeon]|nr:hypothetical protein [Candidatus Altiarchaeota archaeon]
MKTQGVELIHPYFQEFNDRGGLEHLQQRWPAIEQDHIDQLQSVTETLFEKYPIVHPKNDLDDSIQFCNQAILNESTSIGRQTDMNYCFNYITPALYVPLVTMGVYLTLIDPSPENLISLPLFGGLMIFLLYCSYSNIKSKQIPGYDSLVKEIGVPNLAPIYQEMGSFLGQANTTL